MKSLYKSTVYVCIYTILNMEDIYTAFSRLVCLIALQGQITIRIFHHMVNMNCKFVKNVHVRQFFKNRMFQILEHSISTALHCAPLKCASCLGDFLTLINFFAHFFCTFILQRNFALHLRINWPMAVFPFLCLTPAHPFLGLK